jgi:Leu/Phe-tRNA-protein transferase
MLELKPSYDIASLMSKIAVELQGDFCYSRSFDKDFIVRLIFEGFLIMCHREFGGYVLLPKLHEERCIMNLSDLRVPKRIRSLAQPFTFSVDKDFAGVIKGLQKQHGGSCWLYPPLIEKLQAINK